MAPSIKKYRRLPATVDAAYYDGRSDSLDVIVNWVGRYRGLAFPARELMFRHDMGTYWHPTHGFVYVPQGARSAGSKIEPLRDDEIIVRTNTNVYAVVFPGDYVVRSRSGFYPLASESFDRSYSDNVSRRGLHPEKLSPAS